MAYCFFCRNSAQSRDFLGCVAQQLQLALLKESDLNLPLGNPSKNIKACKLHRERNSETRIEEH